MKAVSMCTIPKLRVHIPSSSIVVLKYIHLYENNNCNIL